MSKITPLFTIERKGEKKSIVPKVTYDGDSFDVADLLSLVAKKIADEEKTRGDTFDSLGEITFAGHLMLETLHRLGQQTQADAIATNPPDLYRSSYLFMLGMRAGTMFEEEMKIETAFDDSDTRLRVEPKEGDYDPDEAPDC